MTFDDFLQTISSPALRAIAAHWNEARGTRAMPSWDHLQPANIANHLPLVWAFRYDAESRQFVGRLAGERIARNFERNFRGLRMQDLHPPQYYPGIYANGLQLVEGPHLAHLRGKLFRQQDRYGVGERIVLPLSSDDEHCDGLFGASEYSFLPACAGGENIEVLVEGEQHFPLRLLQRAAA